MYSVSTVCLSLDGGANTWRRRARFDSAADVISDAEYLAGMPVAVASPGALRRADNITYERDGVL